MKYIKKYEGATEVMFEQDINYLSKKLSYPSIAYVKEVIEYYKMTDEQVHNLKLAVQYQYLYYEDYQNVVNDIINSKREYPDRVWFARDSELKFKDAYETNFKTKIQYIPKPYPIARYKKHKLEDIQSLNSFELYDVIGKIPGYTFITKFETKYLVGVGRYRGEEGDRDRKTLWEEYQNTERESEFIKIYTESQLVFLTESDIEYLEAKSNASKYNI